MNQELLEQILSCPSLPSLPAVAVRVIELTQNPDVKLPALAETVEHDQALAARILRTANSSFYGLRTKCSTINQALVMLGLSAVKSLALGFSLADTFKPGEQCGFDYVSYWRRGLYTGVAAKSIARAAGRGIEDEAFLGGLLQDIGMMAMYQVLGVEYLQVIDKTGGDHRQLARFELEAFDLRHADIGAMLAQRWKLPPQLVMPVKYHERPTAAPVEHYDLVRCVGLGTVAHDVLTDADPVPALRRFHGLGRHWFGFEPPRADELLCRIADAAREVSSLFRLDTGAPADGENLLRTAEKRMMELARDPAQPPGEGLDALVTDGQETDPLTGAMAAARYEPAVRHAFQIARAKGEPLSLVQIDIDGLTGLAAEQADEAVVGVVTLLKKHFGPMGGLICRLGGAGFAVIVAGAGRVGSLRAATEFREDLRRATAGWASPQPIGASVGAAAIEIAGKEACPFQHPEQLILAASRAASASRAAGGNGVRAFVPRKAA